MSISARSPLLPTLGALAGLTLLSAAPVLAGDLEISIRNVRSADGHIMIALYADEAGYDASRQTAGNMAPAFPGEMRTIFTDVPEGRYAIAAYHDLDDDAKLGRNLLGIPTEPFGFGNDAEVRFSQPGFEATSITVSGALTRTVVTLR